MSGLIFAVESAENEIGADASADEVAALEATVADESAAIQAESNEADVTISQVEAAVQDGEELEAIADVATDSLADGGEGLTEEAAEVAAIAIERARARLGFSDLSRITPAREQFGSSSTRQRGGPRPNSPGPGSLAAGAIFHRVAAAEPDAVLRSWPP